MTAMDDSAPPDGQTGGARGRGGIARCTRARHGEPSENGQSREVGVSDEVLSSAWGGVT